MKNSHTNKQNRFKLKGFRKSNSHSLQHIENTGLSQVNNEMNGTTFSIITNIAHARNMLAKLRMQVEEISILQEIALISSTLENALYNVKAIGA